MATQGNAVIGQSGGPTSVINQSLVGVMREMKKARIVDQLLVRGMACGGSSTMTSSS